MKSLKVRPVINKKNGQINISLKKKDLPNKFLKDIDKMTSIKIKLEEWF